MLVDIRALPVALAESIKWGNPYFEQRGAVVKWYVAKEWINVYFYKGHLLDDPQGVFELTDNCRMRTIKITLPVRWTGHPSPSYCRLPSRSMAPTGVRERRRRK